LRKTRWSCRRQHPICDGHSKRWLGNKRLRHSAMPRRFHLSGRARHRAVTIALNIGRACRIKRALDGAGQRLQASHFPNNTCPELFDSLRSSPVPHTPNIA
jgi:hypothetical protein